MNGYKLSVFILSFLLAGAVSVIIINSDFKNNDVLNPNRSTYMIPEWVKHNAYWWSQGHFTDSEFSNSMEYLINEGVITVKKCEGVCSESENE